MISAESIRDALSKVIDPELRRPITELGMVGEIQEKSGQTVVEIKLTVSACPAADRIESEVNAVLSALGEQSGETISARMNVMTPEEREELKKLLRPNRSNTNPFDEQTLTRVFLIGSGKGGVGKSSITANLAVALADLGLNVGLIDADIFGFSIPGQLGIDAKPTRLDEMILPPVAHDVKVISIGMFIDENKPIAWRGPMLHRAVQQFLVDVYWGDLDVLLVDLPPGTGDVAISLGQLLPTAKSVVVTTPQMAAADVAERSGAVGLQTGQGIFGVIENMAGFEVDGVVHDIFGAGGGESVATRLSELSGQPVSVLGRIPISVALREGSDTGSPVVLSNPEDASSVEIIRIAKLMANDPMGLAGRRLRLSL
jgi:ATP-binding protein involved in chromosome partitioning